MSRSADGRNLAKIFGTFLFVTTVMPSWSGRRKYVHVHAFPLTDNVKTESSAVDPADEEAQENEYETSALAKARKLHPPRALNTYDAEYEHAEFWEEHGTLLKEAWKEWWEKEVFAIISHDTDNILKESSDEWLLPELSKALDEAISSPSPQSEEKVKSFWVSTPTEGFSNETGQQQRHRQQFYTTQQLPKGVYTTSSPLLTPRGISYLRTLLALARSSKIPTRRPNGMNRNGVILDKDVDGAIPVNAIVESFVEKMLVEKVVRPMGRVLFPEFVGCGDDLEYFAFTIQYDGGKNENADADGECGHINTDNQEIDNNGLTKDFELKEHRDASVITLNINLNLPDEIGYGGSQVFFRPFPIEETTTTATLEESSFDKCTIEDGCGTVTFSPGMALLHLGAHRHGSLPIRSISSTGQRKNNRFNLVIWLFGKHGDVRIAPHSTEEQMTLRERWMGCQNDSDDWVDVERLF